MIDLNNEIIRRFNYQTEMGILLISEKVKEQLIYEYGQLPATFYPYNFYMGKIVIFVSCLAEEFTGGMILL